MGTSGRWTIYCHTHVESGRRYVGLTKKTWRQRWDQHVCRARHAKTSKNHWYNAIQKYGREAFSHEILETCHSLEVANLAEECWIEFLDTRDPEKGFNLMKGGAHTPHPVKKLKDRPEFVDACRRNSRHLLDPENRAKGLEALRSPETRSKIGMLVREAAARPGSKERRMASSIEAVNRPEVLAKISAAAKGRVVSSESRAHLSRIFSGRPVSDETRAKISSALQGKMSGKRKPLTRDHAQKISEALLRTHCKRGHPLPDVDSHGRRRCKPCTSLHNSARLLCSESED
ncbi:MAG: GIY-YIG catalytic domain protein [Synergistetes bacterium ADurb.BinA166]|nr:MAG: GIY-YIG catalytic domain protein [Synergistetes bacterium ADurb.BinA166]